jgi:hypothetical protein
MRDTHVTNAAVTICLLVAVTCLVVAAYLSAGGTTGPSQVTTPVVPTVAIPHAFPAAD